MGRRQMPARSGNETGGVWVCAETDMQTPATIVVIKTREPLRLHMGHLHLRLFRLSADWHLTFGSPL
jgi:hypothetical protein